jgi:hypothetical protein
MPAKPKKRTESKPVNTGMAEMTGKKPGMLAMNSDQSKQRRSHARRAKALGKLMG